MNVDEFERAAVEFLERQWVLIQSVLPTFGEEPVLELVDDSRRVTLIVEFPLVFGGSSINDNDLSALQPSQFHSLRVEYRIGLNRTELHYAVHASRFHLLVASAPAIRYEYERDYSAKPAAHIHIHGQNLLAPALLQNYQLSRKKRGDRRGELDNLHFPVGGHRFRPSLEEFLYLVIGECGFRGREGWEQTLLKHRVTWLDAQAATVVRESPELAAAVLREYGYNVESPASDVPSPSRRETW